MKLRHYLLLGLVPALVGTADEAQRLARLARPILSENCFQCHGPAEQEAKLRLDEPNEAIIPGQPLQSALWQRITATNPDDVMPPPESHKSLSPEDKSLLRDWIASGAVYAPHWSFGPIVDAKETIDAAFVDRQEAAPPGRLLRRLALDLTGLPPDVADVERFERGEVSYAAMVDKYLASPHYGEQRARYWLDAARYSDTHGLQNDYFRAIWPYRQWVIDAFNANLPYNEFSTKQLAGDLLPDANAADRIATGFLKSNASTHEGGVIQEEYRIKYLMDRTDTVATTWLGLTAGCASCHDHKFDPLTMQEYYSLTGFFAAIDEPVMNGDRAHNGPIAYQPVGVPAAELAKLIAFARQSPIDEQPVATADVFGVSADASFAGAAKEAQTVAVWLRPTSGRLLSQASGRGHRRSGWELDLDKENHLRLRFLGPGKKPKSLAKREYRSVAAVESTAVAHVAIAVDAAAGSVAAFWNGKAIPMTLTSEELAEIKIATRPWGEAMISKTSHLPVAPKMLMAQRYDGVLSAAQIAKLADAGDELRDAMTKVTAVACSIVTKEGDPRPSYVLKGGAYDSRGSEVAIGTPAALPPMPESLPKNRLGLAAWLFLPDNPLPARVAVNRLWAQFFGVGLVKTQNDFGNQGALPTHPRLLDSLAADFRRDWDVKRLVRRIVMSEAYRQSSAVAAGKGRAHRMRLDGEVIRDQALAVAGLLDRTVGGPPVAPYQPDGIWQAVSVAISDSSKYQQGTGAALYRRSIYTVHKRTAGPPIMNNFDAPSRQTCSVQREVTNTPLQALQLMNDVQFVEAARGLAARAMAAPDPLARMFKLATCRDPQPAELLVLQSLLAKFREADGAALAEIGESKVKVPGPYAMVATTILNTDEVLCR